MDKNIDVRHLGISRDVGGRRALWQMAHVDGGGHNAHRVRRYCKNAWR